MQRKLYHLESDLVRTVEEAAKKAERHEYAGSQDPFADALQEQMDWLAFSMPANFQKDGITRKETMPQSRKVDIKPVENEGPPPQKHPLIKEVKGGKLIFIHPLKYRVKAGDSLSRISLSLTGGKASVADLIRWNNLKGDLIEPGQDFYLADPDDELVNKLLWNSDPAMQRRKNPEIELERLGPELRDKYAGPAGMKYRVQIQLQYNEAAEEYLNPGILAGSMDDQGVCPAPWAPGFEPAPDPGVPYFNEQFFSEGRRSYWEISGEQGQSGGDVNGRQLGDLIGAGMWTINTGVGGLSTYTVYSGGYYKWNEVWHRYKTTTAWRWERSRWNNFGAKARRVEQLKTVSDARRLAGRLTKAGGVLIVADVALSGELKPSHAINAAMLGASTTGVGAIVAGVWFIADFGTMGVNYLISGEAKGIGDMIDESVGTYEMYEGAY